MQKYDYLIVGSGLFGAVFAREANRKGKRCLVIDKRPHLGGNVYCEQVAGINVHKYGAHIFHTSDREIWDYVNQIVPFNRYTNSPIANYKGELYNLPFNMNTFHQLWGVRTPEEARAKIAEQRKEATAHIIEQRASLNSPLENGQLNAKAVKHPSNDGLVEASVGKISSQEPLEPQNLEEQALLLVGRDVYEKLIKGYTEKQWGRPCTELPAFIIRRLPLRFVYDNNYFNDLYQGIPIGGYNVLISKILEGIETRTNCDFFGEGFEELLKSFNIQLSTFNYNRVHATHAIFNTIVYTGAIDAFYDYRFGKLQYRTVSFEQETIDTPNWQGNAVINYTDRETPYTRIIEHKHFESFGDAVYQNPKTVISREYSTEWHPGMEPYYPVNDERNTKLYEQYRALAEQEQNVIFGGRLAEYKYYDMAPTVAAALKAAEKVL